MLIGHIRKILKYAALVFAALFLVFVFQNASSFQVCISEQAKTAAQQAAENQPPFLFVLIWSRCAGHTVFEYRDAVTAVATTFIAIFTATLWWISRSQREDYWLKSLRAYKDNTRRGYDAQMSEVVYAMKDEDLVDLAYFLARLK